MVTASRPNGLKRIFTSTFAVNELNIDRNRSVLLTFDDGPTPQVTDGVLERLARHKARALFFCVGKRLPASGDLLRDVVEAGHLVGNHTYSHLKSTCPWPSAYIADMRLCSEWILKKTGTLPRFFRSPEGRLHPASVLGPGILGMKHVLWSLDSNDWRLSDKTGATSSALSLLAQVRSGDIILLHEYSTLILDLLDTLLPGLDDLGFDLSHGLDQLSGNGADA